MPELQSLLCSYAIVFVYCTRTVLPTGSTQLSSRCSSCPRWAITDTLSLPPHLQQRCNLQLYRMLNKRQTLGLDKYPPQPSLLDTRLAKMCSASKPECSIPEHVHAHNSRLHIWKHLKHNGIICGQGLQHTKQPNSSHVQLLYPALLSALHEVHKTHPATMCAWICSNSQSLPSQSHTPTNNHGQLSHKQHYGSNSIA